MAKIVISLSKNDTSDLLLGTEINVSPSVQKFDNLTEVVVKMDNFIMSTDTEIVEGAKEYEKDL